MKMQLIPVTVVAALIFNWFFFQFVSPISSSQWCCYAAVHLAFVSVLFVACSISHEKDGLVYGYPKIGAVLCSCFCTLLVAVAAIVFIAINPLSIVYPLSIFFLIWGAGITFFLSFEWAERTTRQSEQVDKNNRVFFRECSQQLEQILFSVKDIGKRKEIEKVYDALRSAQITTVPEAGALEQLILENIGKLPAVLDKDEARTQILSDISSLTLRRNQIIGSRQ